MASGASQGFGLGSSSEDFEDCNHSIGVSMNFESQLATAKLLASSFMARSWAI